MSSLTRGNVDDARAQLAVAELLRALGHDPTCEALEDTPKRVARALLEMTAGYNADVAKLLATTFACDDHDAGVVCVRRVPFMSLCEYHLLPFTGLGWIAYIPEGGRVVGLSKLPRVLDAYAQRFQLQERLGAQVADAINEHLKPRGVAVVLEAEHGCMTCRGVRKAGASMVTSSLRGVFRNDPAARAEVMDLLLRAR